MQRAVFVLQSATKESNESCCGG